MSVMMSIFRRSVSFNVKPDTAKFFHATRITQGFEEFYDSKVPGEAIVTGRAWTLTDVRRKVSNTHNTQNFLVEVKIFNGNLPSSKSQSFDDLHRLWFILYKERNLLITERQRKAKTSTPVIASDEFRYSKVKRSMAAIKHVLSERQKIINLIKKEELAKLPADI
jgi:Mitochondrial 39-S ribosomal protein L47 (MRP-L47)